MKKNKMYDYILLEVQLFQDVHPVKTSTLFLTKKAIIYNVFINIFFIPLNT